MTVAELGERMTSAEFTRWGEYYRIEDAAKAGKLDDYLHAAELKRSKE